MRLQGKVAVVTGAGQRPGEGTGNGRATAMVFAREGAKIFLANRSIASVEETRDLIRAEGFEAECMAADVSNEGHCADLLQSALNKYGRVDIIHNNAGIALPDGDTSGIDRDDWDASISVNLTGAMLISKHALPSMRRQKSGCITHVSSIAAIGSIPVISYKASNRLLKFSPADKRRRT